MMANNKFPYTAELKDFQDAEDAWSAELTRVFGKQACNARYDARGKACRIRICSACTMRGRPRWLLGTIPLTDALRAPARRLALYGEWPVQWLDETEECET
jgi:hypothetical protein